MKKHTLALCEAGVMIALSTVLAMLKLIDMPYGGSVTFAQMLPILIYAYRYGAKYGMRALCVAPGPVLTRAAMANMKTLLGRAAEPQEIIDLVLFVASEKGQFINGENIMIDGGRNAMQREHYK